MNNVKENVLRACEKIAYEGEKRTRQKLGYNSIVSYKGKEIKLSEYQELIHEQYVKELYSDLGIRFKLYVLYFLQRIFVFNQKINDLFS